MCGEQSNMATSSTNLVRHCVQTLPTVTPLSDQRLPSWRMLSLLDLNAQDDRALSGILGNRSLLYRIQYHNFEGEGAEQSLVARDVLPVDSHSIKGRARSLCARIGCDL